MAQCNYRTPRADMPTPAGMRGMDWRPAEVRCPNKATHTVPGSISAYCEAHAKMVSSLRYVAAVDNLLDTGE